LKANTNIKEITTRVTRTLTSVSMKLLDRSKSGICYDVEVGVLAMSQAVKGG